MSSPLAAVTAFRIPWTCIHDTVRVLRDAGRAGHEAFVVLGASVAGDGRTATFSTVMAPAQTAHKTPEGLLVTVEGDALFRINRAFYEQGELLAGQVHSHPNNAYHSDTDDHYPLVTLSGALSVVVPDFARHAPDDMRKWAWYRLIGPGRWQKLNRNDHVEIFD